ncbi:MAG: hypothetical protein M1354_01695 [Candidatus Marsarchaeota archaeon]|jgi:hypothetical protein|nr:hypothetical protein [Candidatus Marsarchaeota archaeon]
MQYLPFGQYGFSIAVYVIAIMMAISGIALGLGYAINEKKFKDFGRNELYQSLLNGALVGGMILLFSQSGIVSLAINQMTMSNSTSMQCPTDLTGNAAICLAYNYLIGPGYSLGGVYHSSIFSTTTLILTGLFALNAVLGAIAAAKITIIVVTISFGPLVNPLIAEISYVIKMLGTVAIGALVQGAVLLFVNASAISVILPSGIILRTFYPTRKLGGFLMAMAIGLYVVLPLSYVFDATIANTYSSVNLNSISQLNSTASSIDGDIYGGLSAAPSNSLLSGISSTLISPLKSLAAGFSYVLNWLLQEVAYLIVYTFILPAFSLIITAVAIREFAGVLGSEAFFGRFKLL